MKSKALYAPLLGFSMLFAASHSLADDNVCIINNSSQAIKASGGEGTYSKDYSIPAKGGDQNKCWAFGIGAGAAYYEIALMWGPGGPAEQRFYPVGFTNPDFGAGYFTTEPEGEGSEWPANNKRCYKELCLWHTGKSDVWRLYVEDSNLEVENPSESGGGYEQGDLDDDWG